MLEQFHFLEPLWLLALLPLIGILWLAFQANTDSKAWEKVVDAKLLSLLLLGEDKNTQLFPKFLLAIAWIISVIALADPVWEKVARPIFQTNAARVLVLDLSNSMLIDDLKPNRLARARFKIEDILSREEEGQTGLVLFAGEAFTASPLTRDTETIRSMLKVLTPQIMPVQGSRADLGLTKAHELLKQAGINSGQVLLIADGISQKSLGIRAAESLRDDGHTVSIMAVGTEAGGQLNFRNNNSVTVKLDAESLQEIAESGGGNFRLISTNNSDLKSLLTPVSGNNAVNNKLKDNDEDLQNREWKSTGPYLILLLLPLAALAFRRGWLLNVVAAFVIVGFASQPQNAIAAEKQESKFQSVIDILSKNKAQRANSALLNKQYEKAIKLSDDPLSKGSAEYKLENYEQALSSFQEASGADARYNEGNTLAKLEKYQEAIAAYDRALEIDTEMQDAKDNKQIIQDFLKKQQQSDKNNQSSNENQQGNSDSQNSQQDQQNSDSNKNSDQNANQDQNKTDDSQSAKNSDKQDQENGKDSKNQFSDANQDLDKNKKEAEDEAVQSAQKNPDEESKDKDSQTNTTQASENLDKNEQLNDSDKQQTLNGAEKLAEELSEEEKMAAEQWLRRIPDDPGGLLRRKFRHQYNQNRRNMSSTEQPW